MKFFKSSFSLIEIIVVLILISILTFNFNYFFKDTFLVQARDQLISHINYTKMLALNDNKIKFYPLKNSPQENNQTKYWFKSWWQIRFSWHKSDEGYEYWYEIFSDLADSKKSNNFDKTGFRPIKRVDESYVKDELSKKYSLGMGKDNIKYLPNNHDRFFNLTKTYHIKNILINNKDIKNLHSIHRFMFDAYGNCYRSYKRGDLKDINPYTSTYKPLLDTNTIILCQDEKCKKNIKLCLSPKIGNPYKCQ